MKKFISWRRVSTAKQGRSGLGLDAQKEMIKGFVEYEKGELIADYEEVYTGTDLQGCTELHKAIEHCKRVGATLIIAKTDRFRNTIEALQIYDEMDGKIYFCDCPSQDKFTLTIMFAIYEREALMISIRTKQALKAKRLRDGSWADLWGKNTGTTREQACEKAREVMAKNRREKAMAHPANRAFYDYVCLYEQRNGKIKSDTNIDPLVNELNRLRYKTATGLEFNSNRCRAMLTKTKLMYAKI